MNKKIEKAKDAGIAVSKGTFLQFERVRKDYSLLEVLSGMGFLFPAVES